MALKSVLVTGATGKQGGALIQALLSPSSVPAFNIVAVTRNSASASAKALAAKPNVSVVEGGLDDAPALFKAAGPIWGVFGMQLVGAKEESQGKSMVDAAVASGVKHFVYASCDRGGPASDNDPTNVPHFASKYNIEKHLQEKAVASPQHMTWTILRPVAFMDNLSPNFLGKGFVAMWRSMGDDKKLQLVSSLDVGWFAAEAFKKPEEYRNKAVSLAGDELTVVEASKIFREVVGSEIPSTYVAVGRAIRWGVKEMGLMFTWFENAGFKADVSELRRQHPELQDFRKWLKESSAFVSH